MKNPAKMLTRSIRARMALSLMSPRGVHVDIGCGPDKYLLKRSPCAARIGFDRQIGTLLRREIPVEDSSADYVTMLAVIEHLKHPADIIKECHRILRDDGRLIITTPKAKGLWIMKLYDPDFESIEGGHERHFDYKAMCDILSPYFSITLYREFELGFNQLFVAKKSG